MNSKLFGRTNPNDMIFNIETQEGSDILDGDDGVASIGDATMEHIQGLTQLQRMVYDELIQMPDGNLFRVEDNPRWDDPDEFNLRSKDELTRYLQKAKIPEAMRGIYEEALERAADEEQSDDIMDHQEELVPYEDWEKFGGMMKYWDIPATPKPKLTFAGNTSDMFYDELEERHPCVNFIERVLSNLDRYEWHRIMTDDQIMEHNVAASKNKAQRKIVHDKKKASYIFNDGVDEFLHAEKYVETLRTSIAYEKAPRAFQFNTYENLKNMVLTLAEGKNIDDPKQVVVAALAEMDRFYFADYKKQVVEKTKVQDPLYISLCQLEKRALSLAKSGKEAYSEVKRVGAQLWETGFVTEKQVRQEDGSFKAEMLVEVPRRHHWGKYQSVKAQLQKIRDGISVNDLKAATNHEDRLHTNNQCVFGLDCPHLKKLERLRVTKKPSSVALECILRIQDGRDKAIACKSLSIFTWISTELMSLQKQGILKLSQREKDLVWAAYNVCKQEVSKSINNARKSA